VGELGLVQFSLVDGKVVGKVKSSAQCLFAPDTQVVTGGFEGGVFIGSVTLCQTGAGCAAQRTYPMLGVSHEDAVAGWIRLDAACQSPALDGRSLFFRPATPEEKQKVAGDSSATAIARAQKGDPAVQADQAIAEGQKLIQDSKYGPAREKFRQAMGLDETRWEGYLGFGVTEVKLGHPERSFEFFDKALAMAQARKASPVDIAQAHYNRACAQVAMGDKKAAVVSLRTAVKVGGASNLIDWLTDDTDLNPLRGDEEFKRLLREAQAAHKNNKKPK
jgi:tetratricopeptide (TPR) repeat protein